jgi:putative phage-type endonuclease
MQSAEQHPQSLGITSEIAVISEHGVAGVRMPSGSVIFPSTNNGVLCAEAAAVVEWAKKWPQPAQKSTAWKNQRAYYCTASQHASALSMCPYRSRNDCLRQYAGVISNTFTGNVATRHGERYEDEAVQKYEEMRGVKVMLFGMLPFYEESLWLGGSPDGITTDGILVEVKCPYKRKPNGTVPAHYVPQVQSMMSGWGLNQCHFIEYVPATAWKSEVFDVIALPRSEAYWQTALPKLKMFWEEVTVLRDTVTEDISFGSPPQKKKKRAREENPPCFILHTKPTVASGHTRLHTASSLTLPFMAQFCTQGLGGGANM